MAENLIGKVFNYFTVIDGPIRKNNKIYWKCRLNDSITLNVVPIPWLDVNLVVSHAPKNEAEERRYIIKSYSVDYGSVESTMSVSMISYYGYYPMY